MHLHVSHHMRRHRHHLRRLPRLSAHRCRQQRRTAPIRTPSLPTTCFLDVRVECACIALQTAARCLHARRVLAGLVAQKVSNEMDSFLADAAARHQPPMIECFLDLRREQACLAIQSAIRRFRCAPMQQASHSLVQCAAQRAGAAMDAFLADAASRLRPLTATAPATSADFASAGCASRPPR